MIRFSDSLQFKIPAVLVGAFVLVLGAILLVFSTLGKRMLEEHAWREVVLSGRGIVWQLGQRVAHAESLVTALTHLGESLPHDAELTRTLVKQVMDSEGTEAFIAGGGLWPEPYRFQADRERRSFFWGRDAAGILQYYDDYNDPQGPGYHHEEWYVPARYLSPGSLFWSKSYMDPYSYQPMVTVTAPMRRDDDFYGVTTIDLKLEGLQKLLEMASKPYSGYAFAVDRNGKFLAYPDEQATKLYGTDTQGKRTEEFIDVAQYAVKRSSFVSYADAIQLMNERRLRAAANTPGFDADLGARLDSDSYQIDAPEAQLIAAVLASLRQMGDTQEPIYKELYIPHDDILGQPAFAAVFEMPHTFWKIVTVMPYSAAVASAHKVYWNLVTAIAIVMGLSLVVMLLVTRRILVRPLTTMTRQMQQLAEADSDDRRLFELDDRGELGLLAYWFNRRTEKLLETQRELRVVQEDLEQRVEERTEALREEMMRRQGVQLAREQQMQRMERQHAAIVQLSLHEQLRRGDIVAVANVINETVAEIASVDRVSVWITDKQHEGLELVDLFDRISGGHRSDMWLELEKYPSYFAALAQDRAVAVQDIYNDRRTAELADYARANGVGALLDSPIRVGGELRGVVCFEHVGGPREWQEDEIRFAGEVADQVLHTMSNAERLESERQIRQLAFYDPLTELANRRLLHETAQHEIEVALRHEVFGSLLYLDLDNFKTLNDSLGHHVGDELLVQVARRIRAALRKEDIAARLGGDEFVVLLAAECATRELALEQSLIVARKIQEALTVPYRLHGHEYVITSSMGITLYPEEGGDAADALKQADTAMYRAKDEGKNRIRFYNPEMQAAADRRRQVEQELRTAIAAGEFVLHYQPQIDAYGRVVAVEALVRWRHWGRGEVGPAEFIPVAEETGLILDLGAWILREACRFSLRSTLNRIAVNISAIQFQQADFVDTVKHILQDTGARPEVIMLELTEGVVIADINDTIVKMRALKALGLGMSIDDFGTGYSSLAYLKQMPLDQLKINDKFVSDVTINSNDAIIAETIISMARHLGLQVVAEGVEESEQLQFLQNKGCDLFQGYHISRPLPEADLDVFLRLRAVAN